MKLLLSISLSILLLLQTVNFGGNNLIRFGELIEHAQLHSKEYGDSFLDFLSKHYGSLKNDHFATHEGHEKLPFHKGAAQIMVCFVILDIHKIPDIQAPIVLQPPVKFYYTDYYTSPDDQKIFQPPKHA